MNINSCCFTLCITVIYNFCSALYIKKIRGEVELICNNYIILFTLVLLWIQDFSIYKVYVLEALSLSYLLVKKIENVSYIRMLLKFVYVFLYLQTPLTFFCNFLRG